MESDQLRSIHKTVLIAKLLYEGNPAPAQIAKAASIDVEYLRYIELELVSRGWLTLSDEKIKEIVELITGLEIDSEYQSSREYFGEAGADTREANKLEEALIEAGFFLREDEENTELIHIHKYNDARTTGERLFSFDKANWRWRSAKPRRKKA